MTSREFPEPVGYLGKMRAYPLTMKAVGKKEDELCEGQEVRNHNLMGHKGLQYVCKTSEIISVGKAGFWFDPAPSSKSYS